MGHPSYDIGGLTRYRDGLREQVGPVWFASSDIAGRGFQHVDGGIRTGELVASRIRAGEQTSEQLRRRR